MWHYEAFGWVIESAVRLRPLRSPSRRSGTGTTADLLVRRESLPATPDDLRDDFSLVYDDPEGWLRAYRRDRTVYWFADGVGTLRVEGDDRIAARERSGGSARALADLIVGTGFRTAATLGGDLTVHASAAVIGERAVAFLGSSGRGKSTAAAACYAAGHGVLADDGIAIRERDGQRVVLPGVPRLDVDDAARAALGLDGEGPVDASDRVPATGRPLAAIYVLADGDAFGVEELPARRGTFALLEAADDLSAPGDERGPARALEAAGDLASSVPVGRLVRPRSLDRLAELPSVVAADLEARSAERADVDA